MPVLRYTNCPDAVGIRHEGDTSSCDLSRLLLRLPAAPMAGRALDCAAVKRKSDEA